MVNIYIFTVITAVFIAATLLLGWYGYRHTKNNDEFLLGRNKTNSLLLALSYGATFLSASAVVGFGGMAARYGMVMIWLVVLNLFVGLVVAFLLFGKRTRKIGKELKAFTFSDLLGKRFKSPAIRTLSAVIILVGMPIYCAAVLLGGVNFLVATINVNRDLILIGFSLIVAVYVTYGGVLAVMYNDALQAGIMFIGMAIILVVTYSVIGLDANQQLTDLWGTSLGGSTGLESLADKGMNGWTSMPSFGSEVWLTVVTTFLLGVGIGALAQPQLAVRFMSAKDDRSLNKSLIIGSIFMIVIVGTAYTVGALSNVYFSMRHAGMVAIEYVGNTDMIIPTFVNELFAEFGSMGEVFIIIFILAILCASISTMSALLHTMGAAAGHDLMSQVDERKKIERTEKRSLRLNRISTMVMMVLVVLIAYLMPTNIIAKATSIFMGLTAATLLPTYAHGLFSKRPNLVAAKWSIIIGSISWALWGFFVNAGIATVVGTPLIASGLITFVDPLVVSLPLSCIVLLVLCKLKPVKAEPSEGAESCSE
jgi:Na+/proline symporter